MIKHPMLKYIKEEGAAGPRLPLIMCPGCGSGQILNYTLNAIDTLIRKEDFHQKDISFGRIHWMGEKLSTNNSSKVSLTHASLK